MQDQDFVGNIHHHRDIVLDEQHRDPLVADFDNEPAQILLLPRVQAAGGFVQQQQHRFGCQGAGQFHHPPLAKGERAGRQICQRRQSHILELGHGGGANGPFLLALTGEPQTARGQTRSGPAVPPHHHILEHAHFEEEARVLESAGHARPGNPVGRPAGDGLAVKGDVPRIRFEHAGDDVEQGGFAGAVGSDHRFDVAGLDGKGHVFDGHHPTKGAPHPRRLKQCHGLASFARKPG